jgi:hypothetical protein
VRSIVALRDRMGWSPEHGAVLPPLPKTQHPLYHSGEVPESLRQFERPRPPTRRKTLKDDGSPYRGGPPR